eukprot:COSAG05_NODE_13015_length_444_cov_48.518841_1_plen_77_part_10
MAYISSREIGNVALRPARLEVGHYDTLRLNRWLQARKAKPYPRRQAGWRLEILAKVTVPITDDNRLGWHVANLSNIT